MEAKHTATPYEVQFIEHGELLSDQLCIISTAECREVVTVDRVYHGDRDLLAERATAEFIARACNAHDELIELLKAADNKLQAIRRFTSGPTAQGIDGLSEKINATLAKVSA